MSHLKFNLEKIYNINLSAAGQTLFEQYWATIDTDGIRFFQYQPGNDPDVDSEYENKILGYQTGT